MIKKTTILFVIIVLFANTFSMAQTQFGELRGTVKDAKTGEPLGWANVSVTMSGINKGGASTDENGNYVVKPLPPGNYDIHVTYIGYTEILIKDMVIKANKIAFKDIKMTPAGFTTKTIEIVTHVKPLVEAEGGSDVTFTKEEIAKAPTRSVATFVNLTPGVSGGSFKGQRTSGTVYFVDGVRMRGSLGIPQGSIQEISTISSGIPAEYGDLVGGVVNIVTRGPSSQFHGGVEVITSELIDPFGYNVIEGNLSGPLIYKDKRAKVEEST